jgi:arylsulfatase A-like enzyme
MQLLLVIAPGVLGRDAQHSTSEGSDSIVDSIRPNVLLVIIDSLRRDRLGVHGHHRPTSPKIDALARTGVIN